MENLQKRGRPANRIEKLHELIQSYNGKEDLIPLEKFEELFTETKDPTNSAQTAISAFNRSEQNIYLERVTAYRIKKKR